MRTAPFPFVETIRGNGSLHVGGSVAIHLRGGGRRCMFPAGWTFAHRAWRGDSGDLGDGMRLLHGVCLRGARLLAKLDRHVLGAVGHCMAGFELGRRWDIVGLVCSRH